MRKLLLRGTLALSIVSVLVLGLAGTVTATPPADHPGKGPPDLTKVVFVHYPKGLEARGGTPGPPTDKPPKPDDGGGGGGKLWYKYSGIHWPTPSASFLYNPTGEPDESGDYLGAIQAGFDTWTDVEGSNFSFTYLFPDTSLGTISQDEHNVVGWADLNAEGFTNAIAVTMVWYNSAGIYEVDMAFSNNTEFAWKLNGPDDEVWDFDNTPDKYDVDVQNIATHEAGHWLLLGDMYNKPASEQTMFGISAELDLKKRSLENGDIAGIKEIYPAG